MAALSSFASGSVVYTEDFGTGIASITGGVLVIDGALDALDDRIHTIDCSSSGGLRSTSGASGTLRATRGRSLNIIERTNGHRFGSDNGKQSNSNGSNSRFAGDATNTLIYEHINWTIEDGARSDFDFGAGTNSNGSLGTGVTMRGVFVNIEAVSNGANNNFPHLWSQNAKLEIHPQLGYGLRVANYTQSHGMLIEVQPNATFNGLEIDDISSVASGGGRVVCSPPDNTTYTLFNLNTPDITESNNTSTGKTILVDPVGVPDRSNNWDGYNSTMEIQRTINFNFTGATDATGTIKALHQNSNAQAADADGTINSAGAGSVRVLTNYSAYQAVNGAWTSLDGFQFYATGLGFRKYYSGSTTINVGDEPAVRNVTLTNDAFPDGSAITDYTGTDGADTASEIYRIIKKHELANPTHRTLGTSLATIDANGNIVIDSTTELNVSTSQSALSAWDSGNSRLTIKVVTGISADKDINSLNFGNRSIPAVQTAYFNMPITTSTGTSALLRITAPASYRVGIFGSDGTNHGNNDYASAGTHSFLLTAASTGTTRVGMGRTGGYDDAGIDIDTSAGGVFSHTFQPLTQQVDALGTALYDSTLSTTGIGIEFNATGQPTFLIPDEAVSVKQLYKVFHDTYSTTDGTRFAAFARQQPGILDLGGSIPNSLFLGSDAQLRRAENSGNDAAVRAVVFGGRGGNRVMGDRGDISLVEQVGGGGGGGADVAGIWNALTETYQQAGSFGEKLGSLASAVLSTNRFQFNAPFTDDTAISATTGTTSPNDASGRGWGVLAGTGVLNFNDTGTGVLETGSLLFGTHRPGFTSNAEIDFVFQHRVSGTHSDSTPQPVAQLVNAAGDVVFSVEVIAGDSTPTYQIKVIDGNENSTATLATNTTQNAWHTIAVSLRQDGSYAEARATFDGGSASTLNVSSNVRELSIADAGRCSFTAAAFSELRNIFFCPRGTQSSATGWTIPAGINWNEASRTYAATDGSVISSVPTPISGGGATDLTPVTTALTAVDAKVDRVIVQGSHTAASLPLTFHEPFSPLCLVVGLDGSEILRDSEETGWGVEAAGTAAAGDPTARGITTYDGNSSHVDFDLRRRTLDDPEGALNLYNTEVIFLTQVMPTAFNPTTPEALIAIGAMTISIAPSSGQTAPLRILTGAGNDTSAVLNLNQWNDVAVVFSNNSSRPNNPRVRVSINGSPVETANVGASSTISDSLFGPIGSNTAILRLGAHGTGNSSSGFTGRTRATWIHPDNELYGDAGWEMAAGLRWNSDFQLWTGLQIADRIEGLPIDTIERQISTIEEKTYTSDELGLFPWRAATSQLTSATGSIGKLLAERRNPETKADIAVAVRDVSNASPAANSLGAAVNAIPTTSPSVPSASDNATAVWAATTGQNNTSGSMGARLQATSTHGQPADSPQATAVAKAVWDYLTSATLVSGSFGEHLAGIASPPTAETIAAAARDALNEQVIFGGVTRLQKEERELTRDQGTFAIVNGRINFTPHNAAGPTIAADLSDAVRGPSTITEGS